jgi:hypothetical protein
MGSVRQGTGIIHDRHHAILGLDLAQLPSAFA